MRREADLRGPPVDAPETPGAARAVLTYHRKSVYGAVVVMVILATAAEVPAVHFLVRPWSAPPAWALTALAIGGLLWIVADWRACRTRPIRVEDGTIRIRFGLRSRLDIPIRDVIELRASTPSERASRSSVDLRLALPGASWTRVELASPLRAAGPLGLGRTVRVLGLGVDEPGGLEAAVGAGRGSSLGPDAEL